MSIFASPVHANGPVRAYTGTWASKPDATLYPAGAAAPIFITDVWPSGSFFYSNGSRWVPVNGMLLLDRLTLPLVKAPTFTGATNGAITLGTASASVYEKCYMYFPANSLVASHSAGWYYTEMSSTTAGVVYNNTYTPAAGTYPKEPTSKTAFSGAVPGGAGVTSKVSAFIVGLKGGMLGENGVVNTSACIETNNSAGLKYLDLDLASTALNQLAATTSLSAVGRGSFRNVGSQSRQRGRQNMVDGSSGSAEVIGTVDTSSNQNITYSLTTAVATDLVALTKLVADAEVS